MHTHFNSAALSQNIFFLQFKRHERLFYTVDSVHMKQISSAQYAHGVLQWSERLFPCVGMWISAHTSEKHKNEGEKKIDGARFDELHANDM